MDLSPYLRRPALKNHEWDPCGLAAYRVNIENLGGTGGPGAPRVVGGIALDGWHADRCALAVAGIFSQVNATVAVRLYSTLTCGDDGQLLQWTKVAQTSVVLVGGISRTLDVFTASGPLGAFWVVEIQPDVAADVKLAVRMVLDRAGGGNYVFYGEGTTK